MKAVDLTGQRFGELVAIKPNGRRNGNIVWLCQCDCGGTITTWPQNLRKGITNCCGCKKNSRISVANTKHGHGYGTALYGIWSGMIQRCTNSNRPNYHRYGGRGITVCSRWLNSFANFLADMGQPPSAEYQIDRINNNGNYEPTNCRWATRSENCRNRGYDNDASSDGIPLNPTIHPDHEVK